MFFGAKSYLALEKLRANEYFEMEMIFTISLSLLTTLFFISKPWIEQIKEDQFIEIHMGM